MSFSIASRCGAQPRDALTHGIEDKGANTYILLDHNWKILVDTDEEKMNTALTEHEDLTFEINKLYEGIFRRGDEGSGSRPVLGARQVGYRS